MDNQTPTAAVSAQPEKKKSRKGRNVSIKPPDPQPSTRDEFIMDTNNSSIVSKRSVEKLYYSGQPEYLRYFVSKFKRRSPLINRGYWLRMKAIEHTVDQFLREPTSKRKLVINLGCGYDPLPFMFLGKQPEACRGTLFVDVDYPKLMQHKVGVIDITPPITRLLRRWELEVSKDGLLGASEPYVAIGCDMNSAGQLKSVLEQHLALADPDTAILFIAEVSVAYMERDASQAVLEWAASYEDARFCLLEQHLPNGRDHPFAQTMLAHFQKLRTPLNAIGTLDEMRQRFLDAGFPQQGILLRTLWELWADPAFLTDEERAALDRVEPFDEWEEFALFGSHYFLMVARTKIQETVSSPGPAHVYKQVPDARKPDAAAMEKALRVSRLPGPNVSRRFAALMSDSGATKSVGILAGLGAQERRADCDTYSQAKDATRLTAPPLRTGIQCHTVTQVGQTRDVLVVGGRSSPDRSSQDCWISHEGTWSQSHSLRVGRYRHTAVAIEVPAMPSPTPGVLVCGGKTSNGEVLDDWILWTPDEWRTLRATGDTVPPRFGASMITDKHAGVSGILVGGMSRAGLVLNDLYHWSVAPDWTIDCQNMTSRALSLLKSSSVILGRFGGQLVRSDQGVLLIGGICANRMLTNEEEVLNMKSLQTHPLEGDRPLLFGFSVVDVEGGVLVLGGGATCFSFGTYWNQTSFLSVTHTSGNWRMLSCEPSLATDEVQHSRGLLARTQGKLTDRPKRSRVPRRRVDNDFRFEQFLSAGRPVIFTEASLGPCARLWDQEYLQDKIGAERKVVVHASPSSKMDFQRKNFGYLTKTFRDFVQDIGRGERMYLRALSQDAPSDKPTNLADDYPEIAADFELPGQFRYVVDHLHSSPLRISGPVTMWMHYDVMANVLCQIRGKKRVLLYPPRDVGNLDFAAGGSSSSVNAFHPDEVERAKLARCHSHEALLEPGDILFIPPMWIHTAEPTEGMSIAVNIFFRSLDDSSYAAGRDVYGNRDLAAYERGRKDVGRIIKSFQELPADISGFYLQRLAAELHDEATRMARSVGA